MIEVDPPQLLLGLALFGLVAGWLMLDWHVRSIRSVVLLLAGLGVTLGAGVVLDWPISLLGLLLAGVLVLPVAARHPAVMPLTAADAAMTREIAMTELELVRAGRRLKRNPGSAREYAQNLEAIRRRLRRVEVPDEEWRFLLARFDDELSNTLALASGQGRHEGLNEERAANRARYRELIEKRRSFWR